MAEKILLGRLAKNAGTFADGENIYLSKHSWDCGWYWGFGYIGNSRCHFHMDNLMAVRDAGSTAVASDLFESTNITDSDWWVIRDLFKQAYALKDAAEVYQYGGHQSSRVGVTDLLKSSEKAAQLNADLSRVLDAAWAFVAEAVKAKEVSDHA